MWQIVSTCDKPRGKAGFFISLNLPFCVVKNNVQFPQQQLHIICAPAWLHFSMEQVLIDIHKQIYLWKSWKKMTSIVLAWQIFFSNWLNNPAQYTLFM